MVANDVQANILRQAMTLFAAQGYTGVSVRSIAAEANVTLPLIYHYFPDKQTLYDVAVHNAFAFMTERLIEATQSGLTGEARLSAFLGGLVGLLASDAPEVRLVDRELMEAHPETMRKLGADLIQRPHDALTQIIRDLAPAAPAQEIAEHIISAASGAIRLRAVRTRLRGVEHLRDTKGIVESLYNFTLSALMQMSSKS